VAGAAGAAAEHHSRPAAGTAGTSDLHSDLLVSELLYTGAAVAELLADELQRRRKQCCRGFLNGLLQEHWVALNGHDKSVQSLSPASSVTSPFPSKLS